MKNPYDIPTGFSMLKFRILSAGILLFIPLMVIVFPCLVVGIFIYEGIHTGREYDSLQGQEPVLMTVVKVEKRILNGFQRDYVATGFVNDDTINIEVSIPRNQFRNMLPGNTLGVYHLPSGEWADFDSLEASKPIFTVFGFHFSWHLPAGVLMLAGWIWLIPYTIWRNRAKRRGVQRNEAREN